MRSKINWDERKTTLRNYKEKKVIWEEVRPGRVRDKEEEGKGKLEP